MARLPRIKQGARTLISMSEAADRLPSLGLTGYLTESWVIGRGNFATSIAYAPSTIGSCWTRYGNPLCLLP